MNSRNIQISCNNANKDLVDRNKSLKAVEARDAFRVGLACYDADIVPLVLYYMNKGYEPLQAIAKAVENELNEQKTMPPPQIEVKPKEPEIKPAKKEQKSSGFGGMFDDTKG